GNTGGVGTPVGSNAVQTLSFAGNLNGGNFTLTFNGQTTANIAYSTTETTLVSNIQTALNALTNINPGNTVVGGVPSNTVVPVIGPITVTFQNALGGIGVPLLVVNNVSLTVSTGTVPASPAAVVITTPGGQAALAV